MKLPRVPRSRASRLSTTGGGVDQRRSAGQCRARSEGQAAINHYFDSYRSLTALAIAPTSLINFGEAVNFPLIFGAILALFGAATLLHLLVVSVSRRRQEIGLLKVLGFVNGQVASTVSWQATTLALVGTLIGVPSGIVVGRAVWHAFAEQPRRRASVCRTGLAPRSPSGGGTRRCKSHRCGPRDGCDEVQAARSLADDLAS